MERIYDHLERIRQLWKELEQANPNSREYDAIMKQIRVLSDEYNDLIDAPKKPSASE